LRHTQYCTWGTHPFSLAKKLASPDPRYLPQARNTHKGAKNPPSNTCPRRPCVLRTSPPSHPLHSPKHGARAGQRVCVCVCTAVDVQHSCVCAHSCGCVKGRRHPPRPVPNVAGAKHRVCPTASAVCGAPQGRRRGQSAARGATGAARGCRGGRGPTCTRPGTGAAVVRRHGHPAGAFGAGDETQGRHLKGVWCAGGGYGMGMGWVVGMGWVWGGCVWWVWDGCVVCGMGVWCGVRREGRCGWWAWVGCVACG
jgi:hypothetical protein